jgi:hypothetical protein
MQNNSNNNGNKVRALSPNRPMDGIKVRLDAKTSPDDPDFVTSFAGALSMGVLGTYRVRVRLEEDLHEGATLFLDEVTQAPRPNTRPARNDAPPRPQKNATVIDFVREVKRAKEHFSKVEGSFAGKEYILRSWKSNDLPRDMGLRATLLDQALEKGFLQEQEVPSFIPGDGMKVALVITAEGETLLGNTISI